MHPITLRLPTELLSELDEEANEAGFSSRSEYIRHLLQNRKDASELFWSDTESTSSDHDPSKEVVDTVDELTNGLAEMNDRVDDLEETVDQLQSEVAQTHDTQETEPTGVAESSTSDDSTPNGDTTERDQTESQAHDDLDELNEWLRTDGPESDDARAVMRDAAQILAEQGPLSAGELKEQLADRYPGAYSSVDTLWKSTVQRLYEDAPGFEKPEYGTYAFSIE